MNYLRNSKILVAFICLNVAHHASGAPQGWTQQRHSNRTAWNQRLHPARVATPYQPNTNYYKPNSTHGSSSNWQHGNGTYQPQGERVWLNSNQSHPFMQVPGFRNPPNHIFAAAKQPNRSLSEGAGWRQPNSWGNQNHNATQRYPAARPNNNFTYSGQIAPNSAGWAASVNPASGNTNWQGGLSNGSRGGNAGLQANQWNNTAAWNARLPGNAVVAGLNAGNSSAPTAPFGGSAYNGQHSWNAPNNPSPYGGVNGGYNSGAQLAPLSGHANTGVNYPNGSKQQSPSHGPYNTNPYANLFA